MKTLVEIEQLRSLIARGKELLSGSVAIEQPKRPGILIPAHIATEKWLLSAIDFAYSYLPEVIINSEFSAIHEARIALKSEISTATRPRISAVLDVLDAYLRFFEWMLRFDDNSLNPVQKAHFWFIPLKDVVSYLYNELMPKLKGLENGRTKRTALLHLFGRIFILIRAITKLDEITCYQSLISSLRSELELFLDFKLVQLDCIQNGVEKFFTFSEIYKFRSARNLERIDKELQTPQTGAAWNSYKTKEQEILATAKQIWNSTPEKLNHWTNLGIEQRAKCVKELQLYREVYYYGNMFVHSGFTDFPKTADDAHLMCAHVYGLSLEILKNATEAICTAIQFPNCVHISNQIQLIALFDPYFQKWKSDIITNSSQVN